jgi:rSAM/selenodomain-associated transferase 2
MISVVIPTLDEETWLGRCLDAVERELPGAEILIADGGSSDGTVRVAMNRGARVLRAPRGRGSQCRAGSEAATGEWLVFLHADALLEPGCGDAVRSAIRDPSFGAGTFRLDYRRPELLYRVTGWTSRTDSVLTSFGDQGIVVRRSLHERAGGMPAIPLFEDVRYLECLRTFTRIRKLNGTIVPSIRRYRENGLVGQLAFNLLLMLLHGLGVSPVRLARWYRAGRRQATPRGSDICDIEQRSGPWRTT